jgi:hypothetical protein
MLNKAREIMKQRESMIKEAQETLVVLGATNEATIVTNEIVINKGKIVEVPVVKYETKEVVVDNTDTETIEMLRETIRRMNQTINDMNKEHDELYKLYLEEQREKAIWADAHAELKEVYEQQMIDMTSEFELQLDELNRKYSALDSENEQLDREIHVLTGQVAGYEAQLTNKDIKIESLEKQIADAKEDKVRAEIIKTKSGATIEVVDDPDYNDVPEEKPATNNKPMNNPISLTYTSLHVTHDAIKAIAHDKANGVTFHFVWKAGQEKLPCFSATGARGTWSRMNGTGMYRYGKQIVEDFKQLAEEKIISKTKDGKVKTTKANKPNKPEDKPVVKVTKEVAVETNDDPLGNTDDMEFDCFDC